MTKWVRKKKRLLASEAEALAADRVDQRETATRSLVGSVSFLVSDEELIEPLFEDSEPDPIE